MRNAVFYVWILLCLAGVVSALMPIELFPDSLTPFTSARGTFAGEAVEIAVPKSKQPTITAEIIIRMERGVCAVSTVGPDGIKALYKAGEANSREDLSANSQLVLNPEQNRQDFSGLTGLNYSVISSQCRKQTCSALSRG